MLCCLTPLLHAQTALSGKVVSAGTNEPLVGVNIRVDNSLTGCTTNGRGEFTIDNLPGGQHTLRFSYIGFTPGKYTTDGQETDILVKLEESYSNLSQVVVTGTGTHRRMTDSPVPVSVITAKEIGGANVSTLEEALVKLTPNISSYTNGMGTTMSLNGINEDYILILENGKRLAGEDRYTRINVANMSLCRHKRGGDALMVIETDQHIKPHQVAFLSELTGILSVTYYDKEDDDDVSGFDEGNL